MENKESKEIKKEGNPLVSAERLHRFKCPFCGSKDKNIMNVKKTDITCNIHNSWTMLKIVTCNDCGYTMFFGHSALAVSSLIVSPEPIDEMTSEEFVRKFHMENHEDPKINPHTGETRFFPARNNQ